MKATHVTCSATGNYITGFLTNQKAEWKILTGSLASLLAKEQFSDSKNTTGQSRDR